MDSQELNVSDKLYQKIIKILEELKIKQKKLEQSQKDNAMKIIEVEHDQNMHKKKIKSLELEICEMKSRENEIKQNLEELTKKSQEIEALMMEMEDKYENTKKVCFYIIENQCIKWYKQ